MDGLVGGVVQLGHVAGGVGQQLVDHDGAGGGDVSRVVEAGRAAHDDAGPPRVPVTPRTGIRARDVLDRQRETQTVRDVIPAVAKLKAVNDLPGRIPKLDPFAGVVQASRVHPRDGQARAIFGLERICSGT